MDLNTRELRKSKKARKKEDHKTPFKLPASDSTQPAKDKHALPKNKKEGSPSTSAPTVTVEKKERFIPFAASRPERPPLPPQRLRISVSKNQDWHQQALAWNPRLYETADRKWDDLSTGRSCVWKQDNKTYYEGTWECRDCGDGKSGCTLLQPRGRCPQGPYLMHWDDNENIYKVNAQSPRRRTHFRPEAKEHATTMVQKFFSEATEYESAPCSSHLELPCFDINRCSNIDKENGPMKVYIHNVNKTAFQDSLKIVHQILPGLAEATSNHSDACLFLVAHGSFETPEEMVHSPEYMAGQNHVIVNSNLMLGSRGDHPFPHHFNYELAALMSSSLEPGFLRPGYDQVHALPSVWRRPHKFNDLELHRKRRLLLSFKGRILHKNPGPYQAYRWLAAEYWYNQSGVYVDANCGDNGYELEGNDAYGELLLNSTFVFAPGGNGQTSYRFTEALNADAIPVVMSYSSLPFEPEIDWSGCAVKVAEARIPDVPRMLRAITEDDIKARRERCRTLFHGVIGRKKEDEGWTSRPLSKGAIVTALQIWRQRIKQAFFRRQGLTAIDASFEQLAIAA